MATKVAFVFLIMQSKKGNLSVKEVGVFYAKKGSSTFNDQDGFMITFFRRRECEIK